MYFVEEGCCKTNDEVVKDDIKSYTNEEEKIPLILRFFGISNKSGLTAKKANMIARFGTPDDFEDIIKKKIKEIDNQINSKLQFSSQERLLALIVPKDQSDLFEEVKKHYDERGFKTFYVDKSQVPEFGDSRYLFISWDI